MGPNKQAACDICFPRVNGGIFRVALRIVRRSRIKNPLSAITSSPSSIMYKNPDASTIFLSDIDPVHISDTKQNVPCGVIPTRHLAVFLCLYVEYDCLCIDGKEGFRSCSSVQSIMTRVSAKKRKELGNVERTCCRVGHLMINCNSRDSRWLQVVVILLTNAEDTPIKSLSMSTSSPCRRRSKVKRSSSFIVRSRRFTFCSRLGIACPLNNVIQ